MAVFLSYSDGNRLEEVMRMVLQLNPTDSPFTSGMMKDRVYNTLVQWPEDTLYPGSTRTASGAGNAKVEGADFSYPTLASPSRVTNVTQIFDKPYAVSSTETWVKGAGVDNEFLYQQQKALLEIGTDVEHTMLRGSRSSGNASVARRLAGALNFVTTNATSVASSTKLTESFFNGQGENIYGQGGRPDEVYVGARLKRIITSFTAGSTKNVASEDKRLTNAVDVYESDFGLMKILLSRDMPTGTNGNSEGLLMIQNRSFRMGVGEAIHILPQGEVAQTGHSRKGALRGELTLKVLGERHGAKVLGLSQVYPS